MIKTFVEARAMRPLLVWVLAVRAYLAVQPPQEWLVLLIVGLAVALTLTVARVRKGRAQMRATAGRAWQLAERLAKAVEDRIRGNQGASPLSIGRPQPPHGQVPPGGAVYGHVGGPARAYDAGALLSSVAAVLAAEGIPTNAAPALPAVVQMLANLGVQAYPGMPAPTALGLVKALEIGAPRRVRVLAPALLASVIRVVLTHDAVLPEQISTDTADVLTAHSAQMLMTLGVQPGDAGSLADWPIIAQIIDSAPLPIPYEAWGR
ncbi:MAG: hypothetical protein ACRDRY_19490 [Pseudonocardiaceae bacterium]